MHWYKGWAKGLRKAGYAEDRQYPQKLISLIERYNLQQYDSKGYLKRRNNIADTSSRINGVPYTVANEGETMKDVARRTGVPARKLRKYNDIIDKRNPVPGERLYLKKKRSKAAKGTEFHTTGGSESLYSIAQEYGIRLMDLYDLNPQYKSYTKLKVGDVIRLR